MGQHLSRVLRRGFCSCAVHMQLLQKSGLIRNNHGIIHVDLLTTRSGGSLEMKERNMQCSLTMCLRLLILS